MQRPRVLHIQLFNAIPEEDAHHEQCSAKDSTSLQQLDLQLVGVHSAKADTVHSSKIDKFPVSERWADDLLRVQILIVGGSSADCADMNTPASGHSMLINADPGADHTPAVEDMPVARVVSCLSHPIQQ